MMCKLFATLFKNDKKFSTNLSLDAFILLILFIEKVYGDNSIAFNLKPSNVNVNQKLKSNYPKPNKEIWIIYSETILNSKFNSNFLNKNDRTNSIARIPNSANDALLSFVSSYVRITNASSFFSKQNDNDEFKFVKHKLNSSTSLHDIFELYKRINRSYKSKPNRLRALVFVSSSNELSVFKSFLQNIKENFANSLTEPDRSKTFYYFYLNPDLHQNMKIIEHFKVRNKLDKVNFYVKDTKELYLLSRQKTLLNIVDKIIETNDLIKDLVQINNLFSVSIEYETSLNSSYLIQQQHFEHVEPLFSSNELVAINCNLKTLHLILKSLNNMMNSYNKLTQNHRNKIAFNITNDNKVNILWLPDHKFKNFHEYNSLIDEIIDNSHRFTINIINWNIDLSSLMNKIVRHALNSNFPQQLEECLRERDTSNDIISCSSLKIFESGRHSIRKLSDYATKNQVNDSNLLQLQIRDNSIVEINSTKKHQSYENIKKNKKPIYRIVSNSIEPFVFFGDYNSDSDSYLNATNKCRVGVVCFDLDIKKLYQAVEHDQVDIIKKLANLLNKHHTVNFIRELKSSTMNQYMNSNKRCCTGYIVDLIEKLSHELDFEYELYFSKNSDFGNYDNDTASWTGLIDHLLTDIAHIVVGPLLLNVERIKYIDFTREFLQSGFSLLTKVETTNTYDMFMFMKPFSILHWNLIIFFSFFAATALALLEFNSPFGLNPRGRQRARNYTLGSAINLVSSLMFMHTVPAKSPKSWPGKWTQNLIAGFALFFIATYTAQMASILSSGHDSKDFNGIDDPDLLNIKVGYVKNSAIEYYLCKNAKKTVRAHCNSGIQVKNEIDGIRRLQDNSLDVYISQHEIIKYMMYLQHDCKFKITGAPFANSGYAFGIQKRLKAELTHKLDNRILAYYENGYLDTLYAQWFQKRTKCNKVASDEKIRIDLYQYRGVYAYLGIGVIAAILVLLLEHALYKWTIPWLRNKPRKSQWKDLKLMLLSQRIYRIVHCEKIYEAKQSAKDFFNVIRNGDFEAMFQKSFRKKQLESMQNSMLNKRPKFWALIEASTEKFSKDSICQLNAIPETPEKTQSKKMKYRRSITAPQIPTLFEQTKKEKVSPSKNLSLELPKSLEESIMDDLNELCDTCDSQYNELETVSTVNKELELTCRSSDFNIDIESPVIDMPEFFSIDDSDSNSSPRKNVKGDQYAFDRSEKVCFLGIEQRRTKTRSLIIHKDESGDHVQRCKSLRKSFEYKQKKRDKCVESELNEIVKKCECCDKKEVIEAFLASILKMRIQLEQAADDRKKLEDEIKKLKGFKTN